MSEVNPNTPVEEISNSNGEANLDNGGGPLTFDELEEITSRKQTKKVEKKDDGEEKKEKNPDMTKDSDKSSGNKNSAKNDKKPADKKSEKEPSDTDHENPDEEVPARKTIKAKYADDEFEIDEEAVVPVTVDGQEFHVPVKDLLSNYSGKTAWDKKFTELSKMKKEFSERDYKLREVANLIRSIHEEQDPHMQIYNMARVAGVDPVQFRKDFFEKTNSALDKYQMMTEDERKADDMAFEARIHKHRADTLQEQVQQEQAYTALQARVESLRARHDISEDEFADRYEKMAANEDAMARQYGDRYQRNPITPELVTEFVIKDRLWDAAEQKISSLGLKIQGEARNQTILKHVLDAYAIGLTPSEMTEVLDEVFGEPKAQRAIQRKKEQVESFKYGNGSSAQQAKQQKDEPLFFDDI